jgi:hypothetical protein
MSGIAAAAALPHIGRPMYLGLDTGGEVRRRITCPQAE